MANKDNLIPANSDTPESLQKARENGRKGGIISGQVKRKKKLMSEIYANFLQKEHEVIDKDGSLKKISGTQLLNKVMSKVLSRGDSSSVRLMKEIREGTEGKKIKLDGLIEFKTVPASQIKVEDLDESTNRK